MKQARITPSDADEKRLTKSPGRVTQMLELIARAGMQGITLTELSKQMDSPRTSLIGLIESLLHENYVVRHGKNYRSGWSALRLATAIVSNFQLPALARPQLERLARETGETAMLCIFTNERREIVYVEKFESNQSLRFTIEIGSRRPLYCSAGGRAMLAFQPEEWQSEYLKATKLERLTSKTIVEPKKIREQLARIRKLGYSVTIEESAIGVTGVSSPILDQFAQPVAAVVIGAPLARGATKAAELGKAVKQTALEMSLLLGYKP